MDNFLVDLMCETANVQKLLDELLKSHLAKLEKLCNAVGVTANIIRFGDDNGRTQDTFMESEIYRQLFKPQHKVLCDYVREHGRIHTFIHFYDSIPLFMSDLIDAGIKIFNPVQTNVYFMEFEFLKNEFGKDCTFWDGGIETSGALNNGISQQVRDQVFKRINIFSGGGGFGFNTVHNILPDVPPENIGTIFDMIYKFNNKN